MLWQVLQVTEHDDGKLVKGGRRRARSTIFVWEVHDERVQFMSRQDALHLDESLDAGDVSRAWLVWSRAAETALADAYQFCGGPIPSQRFGLGRESALFRVSSWWSRSVSGGHKVRKAPGNAADAMMLLMFSCTAIPLLPPSLT